MSIYTKKFYLRLAFAILFFSMVQGKTFAMEVSKLVDSFNDMRTPEKIKLCLQQFSSGIFRNESLRSYEKKGKGNFLDIEIQIDKAKLLRGIIENILLFPLVFVKQELLFCTICADYMTAGQRPCINAFREHLGPFLNSPNTSTRDDHLLKWARVFGGFVRVSLGLLMVLFICYFAREWQEKEMNKNQVESAFSAADNRMISIKAIGTIWYYYTWPMRQYWMPICSLFAYSILQSS